MLGRAGEMALQLGVLAVLCRGPGFSPQHPHGNSEWSTTPVSGAPSLLLASTGTARMWYIYIHESKTLTQVTKINPEKT